MPDGGACAEAVDITDDDTKAIIKNVMPNRIESHIKMGINSQALKTGGGGGRFC